MCMYKNLYTFTLTWSYTFIFILIYDCSIWTLTSIKDTDLWTGYRLSSVTCSMTIRVWSTFSSNLSFDGASWKWVIIYLMEYKNFKISSIKISSKFQNFIYKNMYFSRICLSYIYCTTGNFDKRKIWWICNSPALTNLMLTNACSV